MTRTSWTMFGSLGLVNVAFILAMAQPAWSMGLDRGGTLGIKDFVHLSQLCPNVKVTKAAKSGSDRAYVLEGPCNHPDFPPFSIKGKAAFTWLGQWGDASESIEVIGPVGGKINTSVKKCDKDPFVSPGVYNCTGEKKYSTDMKVIVWWKERPLLGGAVPANQVFQALSSPPAEPGVVRIVSPTQNQAIPITKGFFEVKFEDSPAVKPDPDGAVKLEWQRFDGRSGWAPHPGPPTYVEYYKMTQMVSIKDKFPNTGKYRVRAMASPRNTWTWWREFLIIGVLAPSQIQKKVIKQP